MHSSQIKKSLVGRFVYFNEPKEGMTNIYDLTPRKLYKVIEHEINSTLIMFYDDKGYRILTGLVEPSAHLNELATFSLLKEAK